MQISAPRTRRKLPRAEFADAPSGTSHHWISSSAKRLRVQDDVCVVVRQPIVSELPSRKRTKRNLQTDPSGSCPERDRDSIAEMEELGRVMFLSTKNVMLKAWRRSERFIQTFCFLNMPALERFFRTSWTNTLFPNSGETVDYFFCFVCKSAAASKWINRPCSSVSFVIMDKEKSFRLITADRQSLTLGSQGKRQNEMKAVQMNVAQMGWGEVTSAVYAFHHAQLLTTCQYQVALILPK